MVRCALTIVGCIALLICGCTAPPSPRPSQSAAVQDALRLQEVGRFDDALALLDETYTNRPTDPAVRLARRALAQYSYQANTYIYQQLKYRTQLRFDGVQLNLALDHLGTLAGITIEPDWESLEQIGVTPETPLTDTLDGPLRDVLDDLSAIATDVDPNAIAYRVVNGVLVVGVRDEKHLWGDAQLAYFTLGSATVYAPGVVGVAAARSPAMLAMEELDKLPNAAMWYDRLITDGATAAQLYGLRGLAKHDPQRFEVRVEPFLQREDKVVEYSGCDVMRRRVGDLAREIASR